VNTSSDLSAGYLNNSALVAANAEYVFLSLFIRDEVRAYDRLGRLRWVSQRGLGWAAPATAAQTPSGTSLNFSAVNLGITADDRTVYALSYADSSERELRLDMLDAATGVVERTTRLGIGPWLLSLDGRGSLWVAPLDTLLTLATPRARAPLPGFRLATINGDTFDLASTRGRVTLVNFWASWCPPCREEFPLMNRLSKELANAPFTIVAVNEDVDEQAARRFLAETPADFTIPLGRGAMQKRVAYRGLPFTVLLDRQGRIIERFFGFGGPAQFNSLRQRIDAALAER
jgi:thiol-disulfide isomerase/thioredoxin